MGSGEPAKPNDAIFACRGASCYRADMAYVSGFALLGPTDGLVLGSGFASFHWQQKAGDSGFITTLP